MSLQNGFSSSWIIRLEEGKLDFKILNSVFPLPNIHQWLWLWWWKSESLPASWLASSQLWTRSGGASIAGASTSAPSQPASAATFWNVNVKSWSLHASVDQHKQMFALLIENLFIIACSPPLKNMTIQSASYLQKHEEDKLNLLSHLWKCNISGILQLFELSCWQGFFSRFIVVRIAIPQSLTCVLFKMCWKLCCCDSTSCRMFVLQNDKWKLVCNGRGIVIEFS